MKQIYQGIIPYEEEGCNRFTGRADETRHLFDRILRNDYTVYYAASGEGKSSLIRAGLLPILRRRGFFPIYIVFQEEDFSLSTDMTNVVFSRVDEELNRHHEIKLVHLSDEDTSLSDLSQEQLSELEKTPWWRTRTLRLMRGEEPLVPLFIFDQFEEVFTKATYDWTDHFFQWLEDITTDYIPQSLSTLLDQWEVEVDIPSRKCFKALFSLRTEYLGELDYWCIQKHFLPSLQENRICLKPMTLEGASQVVRLNEAVLGAHALRIIEGCSEEMVRVDRNDKPCVSALILSVVCLTLSNMKEDEREQFLDDLAENQETTVNNILYRFYKTKLQSAGLDYDRDAYLIRQIEDAFVDMNGKRRRRNTNEQDIKGILRWVDNLSAKDNGLIKVIGRKELDGEIIKTVEFPHDRLCKAINVAREERRGMMAEKNIRQGEWLQFGLISAILFIIALFWHYMLDNLAPVMNLIIYDRSITVRKLLEQFLNGEILNPNVLSGISTLLLMVILLVIAPVMVMLMVRKTKKEQAIAAATSLIGLLCFGSLWMRNSRIVFSLILVPSITKVGFWVCAITFLGYAIRLYSFKTHPSIIVEQSRENFTRWPLWGGYLFFCAYLFYEFTTRTSFGTSVPEDSAWALAVFPILYGAWAWGFFRMRFSRGDKGRSFIAFFLLFFSIVVLTTLGFIPAHNKQSFGLIIALISLLVYAITSFLLVKQTASRSLFYELNTSKKIAAALGSVIVLSGVFILNLGYNPLVIPSSRVHQVFSWRTVTIVDNNDLPLEEQRFGVLLATNGDTIVPFVKQLNPKQIENYLVLKDTSMWLAYLFSQPAEPYTICHHFQSNPLFDKSKLENDLHTITWNPDSMILETTLSENPVIQKHLHRITRTRRLHTAQDSVVYYSAQLYKQLRRASINYVSQASTFDMSSLKEYRLLDSLQHIMMEAELAELSKLPVDKLEDNHLVDFLREASRSFLLCMIKDRINMQDYISEFSLMEFYEIIFFPYPYLDSGKTLAGSIDVQINNKIIIASETLTINNDVYLGKAYPWYNFFKYLCSSDIAYNSTKFRDFFAGFDIYTSASVLEELKRDHSLIYDPIKLAEWKGLFKSMEYGSYYEMDEEFKWLNQQLLNSLIPIIEKSPNGIYNNAILSICKYLLKVALFRGYDFDEDLKRIEPLLKDDFLELIGKLTSLRNEANASRLEIIKVIEDQQAMLNLCEALGIDAKLLYKQ